MNFSEINIKHEGESNNTIRHHTGYENKVTSKNLTKSIKLFVENSLSNEINCQLKEIEGTSKETWRIDAHNITKALIEQSKLIHVQENINNILDTCFKEVDDGLKYFNNEVDISPLLQPEHISEIVECMSLEKPLDVRLNALRILLRSHFTEAVNGEGWLLLQKKLVDNLCDSNHEVFSTCLKAHLKLASCSSPVAIKECALNLIEGLGRYLYFHQVECKTQSSQSIHFHHSVHLTSLLLATVKESTQNIARFGDKRLGEIIDNLVQLLSIDNLSKQVKSKSYLSSIEIFSYLDPSAKWLVNLTHFTLSSQLFFSCLQKHDNFLKTSVEEMINWLNEPVIPPKCTTRLTESEMNNSALKFSLFLHSLSIFTIISSFEAGRRLFPIKINNKGDMWSVADVVKKLVITLNDTKFQELILTKSTEEFKSFICNNTAKLLCLKENSFLIRMLFRTNANQEVLLNSTKTKIFDYISQNISSYNPFLISETTINQKNPTIFHLFFVETNVAAIENLETTKEKEEKENKGITSSKLDVENCDKSPLELLIGNIIEHFNVNNMENIVCAIQIVTRIYKYFGRSLMINSLFTTIIAEAYTKLQTKLNLSNLALECNDINLSCVCFQYLLQIAISPRGFHILQECNIVLPILFNGFKNPVINWTESCWLLFLSKAITTSEGSQILANESNNIFKSELFRIWDIIEEDHSGSELNVKNATNQLLRVISSLSLTFKGIKAMLEEPEEGSDITLTNQEDQENKPPNLHYLIQNFALNSDSCISFVHHLFALTILDIFVSNLDASLFIQHRFRVQECLLQLQSDNRVDENSEVIIDECSLLRHRVIEKTYLPGYQRVDSKLSHTPLRPDSTLILAKSRSRGNGEFARWLSETRPGLHDHSWLKHARKLYRNSCTEDIKSSTIIELLEQVLKVLPENKMSLPIKWQSLTSDTNSLQPEELLGVQLVIRFGVHHRLIQATQQNFDNLTNLTLLVKSYFKNKSDHFDGFDWFVASAFLLCSGNVDKTQAFLSSVVALPSAPLLWFSLQDLTILPQLESVLETIIAEEMPILYQVLQNEGVSWWQVCQSWISQCWWNVLDWSQICHWFTLAILYPLDHLIYFCAAILYINRARILLMSQEGAIYELLINPLEKIQLSDARTVIEKYNKKYHNILQPHLASWSSNVLKTRKI